MLVWISFCTKCLDYDLIFVKTHEFSSTNKKITYSGVAQAHGTFLTLVCLMFGGKNRVSNEKIQRLLMHFLWCKKLKI